MCLLKCTVGCFQCAVIRNEQCTYIQTMCSVHFIALHSIACIAQCIALHSGLLVFMMHPSLFLLLAHCPAYHCRPPPLPSSSSLSSSSSSSLSSSSSSLACYPCHCTDPFFHSDNQRDTSLGHHLAKFYLEVLSGIGRYFPDTQIFTRYCQQATHHKCGGTVRSTRISS